MEKRTREVLDQIDAVLSKGNVVSEEVWNVLTALRGPDNGESEPKRVATVPIRRAAFPRTTEAHNNFGSTVFLADFGASTSKYDLNSGYDQDDWHFDVHAQNAAQILGLIPDSDHAF